MAFAVTDGALRALHKPTYQAPTSLTIAQGLTEDYGAIYRKQPQVRTTIEFLARNVAQLSLHTFRRISDNDRERLRDHPVAQLIAQPNGYTTTYRLLHSLVSDRGIYDRALWLKSSRADGSPALVRVPPRLWRIADDESWLAPAQFIITGNRGETAVAAEHVVYFRGYNPDDERYGLSPIETLRRALAEEYAAGQMREQVLRNGARVSGYIERPAGATWSDEARTRFRAGWRGQYQGWSATEAGGTPILEDGMKFVPASHNAVDLQYVESRKLTREEVASAYFIPPPMVGILDNASFSNITEQHKMLYQDTLGPMLKEIVSELHLQLLPDFSDTEGVYVEFNMEEKLRGSFEEQAQRLSSSVGAPFLSRNEARALANLPAIDGADDLVVPLNVLVGGQASPRDSVPDERAAPRPGVKAPGLSLKVRASEAEREKARRALASFFARQGQAVRSAIGAGRDEWWNGKRWDEELARDLFALHVSLASATGRQQLDRLGLDPAEYDEDRTLEYLAVVTRYDAEAINGATRQQVQAALDDEDSEDVGAAVAHVFEVAESQRASVAAGAVALAAAAFGTVEAVEQVRGTRAASKTWIVTSGNPRPSHAAMSGETVPLDDTFSNGARWPGDSTALDVDEIAGCTCDVQINF